MDAGIDGTGSWCSNSKSLLFFRMRVTDNVSCTAFVERGKKAPMWMRLANKGLSVLNTKVTKKHKGKVEVNDE